MIYGGYFMKQKDYDNKGKFKYLVQVYNDVEADILEGLLKEHNITVIKRYRGNKGFLRTIMGTVLGVDILVSSEDYEDAKKILESIDQEEV